MRRVLPGLVAVATLLLMPFGGAAGAAHPAYAGKAGDPDYNRPAVGDCHDYTYAEMYAESDTTPVVPCGETHTGKVLVVPRVPDAVAWSDGDALNRIVAKQCHPAFDAALGRNELTRVLTAYHLAVFIPTEDERSQGARWIRCDAFLWRGDKLSPLPYDTAPLIPRPMTDTVRRCLTSKDRVTTCDAAHVYKATGDFKVGKKKYPTRKAWLKIGRDRCPALTTSRYYRFFWPSKDGWKAGFKIVTCYSKTRN